MEQCIIAISGDLGSGKSTVAKLLSSELGVKKFSTGDMQRAWAKKLGITSLELNLRAEADPTIDQEIDNSTVEIAGAEPRVLFDSRLAWHFVPASFKVFLTVDRVLGAKRIFEAGRGSVEEYSSLDEAIVGITERRASENKRYADLYNINPERLSHYDLVIDTSGVTPEDVAARVIECVRLSAAGREHPHIWLSPRAPFPSRDAASLDESEVTRIMVALEAERDSILGPIGLLRVGRYFYIFAGHHRISAQIRKGRRLVPAGLSFSDDENTPVGLTAQELIEKDCTEVIAHAWEAFHGFQFPSYPPHFG